MGFLELPHVDRIKTPGFVQAVDEVLETRCSCGGFTTAGVTWRMWLIYTIQILFLFLAVVIGANIQSGLGLGPTYNAVDILRLVGGISGILAGILGGIGVYIRMRYLLMGNVVLNSIALIFVFLSWAIDASDVSDLNSRLAAPVPVGQTPPNYGPSRDRATVASIFGAFGWVVTIFAFYLTYACYQEMANPSNQTEKPQKQKSSREASLPEVAITMQNNEPVYKPPQVYTPQPPVQAPQDSAKPKRKEAASSPSASTSVHNCPQCKTEWPIDVKFCGECGSKIPDLEPEPQPASPPATNEIWEEHFTDDGYMYYYNPKTGESKWAEA